MAADIFAKIGDIKGESLDSKHKDEVEVLSWSWGVQQSGTMAHGGGGGEGKASFNDFNFTHHVDKASAVLMKACATGEHIKEATITVRKAGKGQQEFLIIKMNDVLITSVNPSGSGDGPPLQSPSRCRWPRSIWNTSRRSRTDRWMPGSISSTTSRATRKASVVSNVSGGAGDMFLMVKGAKHGVIKGESQDGQHKGEIEVLSWSWGMQAKTSLGGGTATGKATSQRSENREEGRQRLDGVDARVADERADPESRADAAESGQDPARVPEGHDRAGARDGADRRCR